MTTSASDEPQPGTGPNTVRPRETANTATALALDEDGFTFVASFDALLTLGRSFNALPAVTEEEMDSVERILAAARDAKLDEAKAAAAVEVQLDCRIASALLQVYLFHWAKGGREATLGLTVTLDVRQLEPAGDDRDLLYWIYQAAYELSLLDDMLGNSEEAEAASAAFRRLSTALERREEPDLALAATCAALNLAGRSTAVAECADRALRLLGDTGDPVLEARIVARKALALIALAGDGASALQAFDAVESLIRFLDLAPSEREATSQLVRNALQGVPALRPLEFLLAAGEPDTDPAPGQAALRALGKRTWNQEGDLDHAGLDELVKLAIWLEDERWRLEPPPDGHPEAKWNTWSFDYQPFGRAVPHGSSLERDEDLDEKRLELGHEVIHVLSMFGDLGRATTALRLALLEVETRLWTFSGPLDRESLLTGVAPFEDGDLGPLAQAEQALELSRKVQALEDAWAPWLEGIAVFGESSAAGEHDEVVTPVTQVLANLVADQPLDAETLRREIDAQTMIRQRQDEADRSYQEAGERLGPLRLRTFLGRYSEKYLGGYLAVRAVVAAWRRSVGPDLTAQMAFRALLHVTRFGTIEVIPDLAVPADEFGAEAIDGMANWVSGLQDIEPAALRSLAEEGHHWETAYCWRGGRLVTLPEEEADPIASVRALVKRALLTQAGEHADPLRVPNADTESTLLMQAFAEALLNERWSLEEHDPSLIARFFGRPTVLPIAQVRCPFWLVQPSGDLIYLLRTSDPPGGPPLHQLLRTSLPPEQAVALEAERRRLRDARMTVHRIADVAPQTNQPEFRGGGINFLVFSYGGWLHIEGLGIFAEHSRIAESLKAHAQQRLLPDPLLDLESTRTADGMAGALRTLGWLQASDEWSMEGNRYLAGPLATRIRGLAEEVLAREAHPDSDLAAERLLALVTGPDAAQRLQRDGLEALREIDPQYTGEVVRALAASAAEPVPSQFLNEHANELGHILGSLFETTDGRWDVRSTLGDA